MYCWIHYIETNEWNEDLPVDQAASWTCVHSSPITNLSPLPNLHYQTSTPSKQRRLEFILLQGRLVRHCFCWWDGESHTGIRIYKPGTAAVDLDCWLYARWIKRSFDGVSVIKCKAHVIDSNLAAVGTTSGEIIDGGVGYCNIV